MFKNETKNAMMAFAVVAMFMLSAFAVVLTPSDADVTGEYDADSFDIYMTTADTFTYQPTANITGTTFTVTGTAAAEAAGADYGEGTAANGGTALSYTFAPRTAVAGASYDTYEAVITAEHSTTNQTVAQTITFYVYKSLAISGVESAYSISQNTASGTTIGTATVSGLEATTADLSITSIVKDTSTDVTSSAPFVLQGGVLKTNASNIATGSYVITLSLTDSLPATTTSNHNTLTKTVTETVTVTVMAAASFEVSPSVVNTFVNDSSSPTITFDGTNLDNIDGETFTISDVAVTGSNLSVDLAKAVFGIASADSTKVISVVNNVDPTLTLITNGITNSDITSGDHAVITYNVTLNGTSNSVAIPGITHGYTVNFYKSLKFTTTPVVSGANAFTSSASGLDMIMGVNVSGATKVKYNWGDGNETVKEVFAEGNTFVTANHTYARAGTYMVTITSCNDFEEASIIKPYTTGAAIVMDADKTLKMTGIKETVDAEANTIVLDPSVIVTAGYTVAYKWTYSIDGAEAVELTAAGTPAWFKAFGGADHKSITISTAQADELPANVKFTCEASVTFEGDEKATTSSASYTYKDSHFMAQNGWIVWVALALLVIGIVLIVFVTGPIMPVNIFTAAAAVITVILFLAKMYMWF